MCSLGAPSILQIFADGENNVHQIRARGHTVPDHDRCGLRNGDSNFTNRNAYPTNPNPRRYSNVYSTNPNPRRDTHPTAPITGRHACERHIAPCQ